MLTDRVAVVEGRASRTGRATCDELAGRGCRVAVLDIDGERAEGVAESLRSTGAVALGIGTDVTDRRPVDETFAKLRAGPGPVPILVASAGQAGFEPFREITLDSWRRILDVNLTGTFNGVNGAP